MLPWDAECDAVGVASVLQCVAVCCSVLQYVAVCCRGMQSVMQYVLQVCCSVFQCVAVCCSMLPWDAECDTLCAASVL